MFVSTSRSTGAILSQVFALSCGAIFVKRVLLTGMSGTGKSTLIVELAGLGYKAVDVDAGEWSEWVEVEFLGDPTSGESPVEPGRDWIWREDRIQALLSTEDADVLFISGCAANMGKFYPQFDHIVLLTAPAALIVDRLAARTNNPYGKRPEEVARVLNLLQTIEPALRKIAGHEVDTSVPLNQVAAKVLQLVGVRE
jgi:shikimate kinase